MKKYFLMALVATSGLFAVACGGDDPNGGTVGPATDIKIQANSVLAAHSPKYLDMTTDGYVLAFSDVKLEGDATDPIVSSKGQLLFLQMLNRPDGDLVIPAGTYRIATSAQARAKTCIGDVSGYVTTDDSGAGLGGATLTSGSIEVTRDGDNYTIVVNVILSDKQTLYCAYAGKIDVKLAPSSQLKEDLEMNMTDLPGACVYSGDEDGIGADKWNFNIYSGKDDTAGIQVILYIPKGQSTEADGIPSGTYEVASKYDGKAMIIPGSVEYASSLPVLRGSWYVGGFKGGTVYTKAPATAGSLVVENLEGDNYKVKFEFTDDTYKKRKFHGEWAGVAPTVKPKAQIGARGSVNLPVGQAVLFSSRL